MTAAPLPRGRPYRRLVAVLGPVTLLGALVVAPWGRGAQEREARPSDQAALMRQKLDHAQRILGGLAEGRFNPIARSARSLRKISMEAARYSLPTDDYRRFSAEFRRLADALAEHAEAEDLDAATLAYIQLTVNCVECHKYVRIQEKDPALPR